MDLAVFTGTKQEKRKKKKEQEKESHQPTRCARNHTSRSWCRTALAVSAQFSGPAASKLDNLWLSTSGMKMASRRRASSLLHVDARAFPEGVQSDK